MEVKGDPWDLRKETVMAKDTMRWKSIEAVVKQINGDDQGHSTIDGWEKRENPYEEQWEVLVSSSDDYCGYKCPNCSYPYLMTVVERKLQGPARYFLMPVDGMGPYIDTTYYFIGPCANKKGECKYSYELVDPKHVETYRPAFEEVVLYYK